MPSAAMPGWPEEEYADAATNRLIVKNTFLDLVDIDSEAPHKSLKRSQSWCGAGSSASDTTSGDSFDHKAPPASEDTSKCICDAGSGNGVAGEQADTLSTSAWGFHQGPASDHPGCLPPRRSEIDQFAGACFKGPGSDFYHLPHEKKKRRARPSKYARAECRAMIKMVEDTFAADPSMKSAKMAEITKENEYLRKLARGQFATH